MRLADEVRSGVARDYHRLSGSAAPPIEIEFYPYSGLHHTLRERDGSLHFRFSDLLEDESPDLVRVAARLLIARFLDRPADPADRRRYRCLVSRPVFRQRLCQLRRRRGRKLLDPPRGQVHDLEARFTVLNRVHFESSLRIDKLGWSRRRSRRVLGHFDQALSAIVINRTLDNPLVPEYVVDYVLYHEMLHVALGEQESGGRRRIHHRRFRQAERQFPDYERANRFIRENLAVKVD